MGKRTSGSGSTATIVFRCLFLSLPHQSFLIVTRTRAELDHGVSADREGVWSQLMTLAVACQLAS